MVFVLYVVLTSIRASTIINRMIVNRIESTGTLGWSDRHEKI